MNDTAPAQITANAMRFLQACVATHYDHEQLQGLALELAGETPREHAMFIGRLGIAIGMAMDAPREEWRATGAGEWHLDLHLAEEAWAASPLMLAGLKSASMIAHAGPERTDIVLDVLAAAANAEDPTSLGALVHGLIEVLHRIDHDTHAQLAFA